MENKRIIPINRINKFNVIYAKHLHKLEPLKFEVRVFSKKWKIAGMIDESMDKEQMKQPAQPWEFRSKKAWQRLIIMIGGVTVNLILGYIIYIGVIFAWGQLEIKQEKLDYDKTNTVELV
jgi:membrane-associated protease RseP (regulator of RpoE activity)